MQRPGRKPEAELRRNTASAFCKVRLGLDGSLFCAHLCRSPKPGGTAKGEVALLTSVHMLPQHLDAANHGLVGGATGERDNNLAIWVRRYGAEFFDEGFLSSRFGRDIQVSGNPLAINIEIEFASPG